jgi:hypothetical protein
MRNLDRNTVMKYHVTRFKSLARGLKELRPFIRNGEHLQTGKPLERFGGLRSREILGNWLLCVAVNSVTTPDRLTFSSDPLDGDGIIHDTETGETWQTEHVLVPRPRDGRVEDIEAQILGRIEQKWRKGGAAYAAGKTLVVLREAAGDPWYPNKIARILPSPLHFDSVWVVGLRSAEGGLYIYDVTRLDLTQGGCPIWRVHLAKDFDAWEVELIQ